MNISEKEKKILKEEEVIKEKMNKLPLHEFFGFYNTNKSKLELAEILKSKKDYEAKLNEYKETGLCKHHYIYIYGKNNHSHFQDVQCEICGHKKIYLGDD